MFQGLGSKYVCKEGFVLYLDIPRQHVQRPFGGGPDTLKVYDDDDHKRFRFAVSYLVTKTHKLGQIGTSAMMNIILNRLFSRSYLLSFITCDLRKVTAATAAGRPENLPFFFPASETSEQRLPASPPPNLY